LHRLREPNDEHLTPQLGAEEKVPCLLKKMVYTPILTANGACLFCSVVRSKVTVHPGAHRGGRQGRLGTVKKRWPHILRPSGARGPGKSTAPAKNVQPLRAKALPQGSVPSGDCCPRKRGDHRELSGTSIQHVSAVLDKKYAPTGVPSSTVRLDEDSYSTLLASSTPSAV